MKNTSSDRRRALVPGWTLVKVTFRLALMLMTGSLLLPTEVGSPDELGEVAFGWPVPFLVQDARRHAPPAYPARMRMGDPRAEPTTLRPAGALADVVLLMLALMLVARALGIGWRERQ